MRRLLAGLFLGSLLPVSAQAISITPAAFGIGKVVESFEGLTLGPNVGASPFANILEPGKTAAYTFASGVQLSAPIPNPGTMSNGVFVHDFALPAGASNGWGANGSVSSAANVPFGTAYLGAFDNLFGATQPVSITLDFSGDKLRAGAYVTGAAGTTVRLDVYSATNLLLESRTVSTVPVAQWGTNFVGIERSEGIRRVVLSGVDFGVDGLTYESAPVPVPETSSMILLTTGLIGLGIAGRPRPPRA